MAEISETSGEHPLGKAYGKACAALQANPAAGLRRVINRQSKDCDPFGLSLSQPLSEAPFDKLRANGSMIAVQERRSLKR